MRYEVRISELDDTQDVVNVWADSPEEAVRRVLDFVDYAERRTLNDRPTSVTELGLTPHPEDLGVAKHWNGVSHRRVGPDGRDLGTLRRPDSSHLAEMASLLHGTGSGGWHSLRLAMERSGLTPARAAVAAEILDAKGDPVSGILVMADGAIFGFYRTPEGEYSIGGDRGWQPPEGLEPTRDAALRLLSQGHE